MLSPAMNCLSCIFFLFLVFPDLALSLQCYSDHSGPNSAGGIELCDEGGVCSSSRIVFRESGVLRTAMSRHCVSRTPDRSAFSTEWPWCHEEWAGGDEGGMEVYTCFCKEELCNQNSFLLPKFNEWISVTKARLKAGPTHPLDILTTIATVAVVGFFLLVIISNVPWKRIMGKKEEVEEESEDEDDTGETKDDAHEKDD